MAWCTQRGISLIEATIVVTAVSILAGAVAPAAARAVDRARIARAIDDGEAIKQAIYNWRDDVFQSFTIDGVNSGTEVQTAVSDGDIPSADITDDNGALTGVQMRWDDPVDSTTGLVDFLERHLVTNDPRGSSLNDYPTTWRGAYIDAPIGPDPWGNRYAVNIGLAGTPGRTRNDTFVLSAGPDEAIDTLWEVNGAYPGDDDIIVMVLRDRNSEVP